MTGTVVNMTDGYTVWAGQVLANDDVDLPDADRAEAVMLTTPGTVRLVTASGHTLELAYRKSVDVYPIRPARILQTGTTAPALVVIYGKSLCNSVSSQVPCETR